jgi:hypothetical protein
MFDKSKPEFWEKIKVNNIVTLKDEQGIEDSMEQSKGIGGLDYTVKSVKTITQTDNLCKWLVFELDSADQVLWMVAKIVDEDVDVIIYFDIPEFPSGSREEMLDNDMFWLFQEPENHDDFDVSELKFSKDMFLNHEVDGKVEELHYQLKPQGQLFGTCKTSPSPSGIGDTFMGVMEYSTGQECENPEFLILEEGEIPRYQEDEDTEGGWITILLGCKVRGTEVDVL